MKEYLLITWRIVKRLERFSCGEGNDEKKNRADQQADRWTYLNLFTAQFVCGRDRKDEEAEESVNDRAKKAGILQLTLANSSMDWTLRCAPYYLIYK